MFRCFSVGNLFILIKNVYFVENFTMKKGEPGYWKWVANTGSPKNLRNPKQLWKLACEYFESIDERPFEKQDFIRSGESAGTIVKLKTIMPYTWQGLELYLRDAGVLAKLDDYRANKESRYTEFADVLARITQMIYDQKYSGAAVGAFNAAIISKDLGLTEKIQQTIAMEQPLFPDLPNPDNF